MSDTVDSIEVDSEAQSQIGKNDPGWGEESENQGTTAVDDDPWGLNEVQEELDNPESEESTSAVIEELSESNPVVHEDDPEKIEPMVGLRYRQRLDVDFQNLIEIAANLIVFAGRFMLAVIVSICIIAFVITSYAAVILLIIEILTRIYYFFNSDTQSAGLVGETASYIGGKIIELVGMLISLIGDFIQSASTDIYCQGGLGFIILILLLSKWAKRAVKGFSNYTLKAKNLIISWWKWAYLPLKNLRVQEEEE